MIAIPSGASATWYFPALDQEVLTRQPLEADAGADIGGGTFSSRP